MAQKVDPFIPVAKPHRPPARPAAPRPIAHQGRSVDGIVSRSRPPQPRFVGPRESAQQQPAPHKPPIPKQHLPLAASQPHIRQAPIEQQRSSSRLKKTFSTLLQVLIFLSLFALGFLARSVAFGQVLILAYAVFVFIFKVESRTTYALALISLGVVMIASLRSDTSLAGTFAVYAFLLLVVGAITMGREARNEA